jgi:hypothetical protein
MWYPHCQSLQRHLRQIAEAQLVAQAPEDHQADDVARILKVGKAGAGPFVKLSLTGTILKPSIAQLRPL